MECIWWCQSIRRILFDICVLLYNDTRSRHIKRAAYHKNDKNSHGQVTKMHIPTTKSFWKNVTHVFMWTSSIIFFNSLSILAQITLRTYCKGDIAKILIWYNLESLKSFWVCARKSWLDRVYLFQCWQDESFQHFLLLQLAFPNDWFCIKRSSPYIR